MPTRASPSLFRRWKDAWRDRLDDAALKVGEKDPGVLAAKERGPPLLPPLRTETKNLLLRRPEELRPLAPFLILIAKTMCVGGGGDEGSRLRLWA